MTTVCASVSRIEQFQKAQQQSTPIPAPTTEVPVYVIFDRTTEKFRWELRAGAVDKTEYPTLARINRVISKIFPRHRKIISGLGVYC